MKRLTQFLFGISFSALAWGWGEAGHHLVGRVAGRLFAEHPALDKASREGGTAKLFRQSRLKLALMGTIPDSSWRNLNGAAGKQAEEIGGPTHYINIEKWFPTARPGFSFLGQIENEKLANPSHTFAQQVGSLPWRAQQFVRLIQRSFAQYPADCEKIRDVYPHPTAELVAYAGILTHFIADASQPYHITEDYDGIATRQKGLHAYFESELVEALEPQLEEKVFRAALKLLSLPKKVPGGLNYLKAQAEAIHPADESKATALLLALASESFSLIPSVREKDLRYAILPEGEAKKRTSCQDSLERSEPCRRAAGEWVNAKGVPSGPKGSKQVAQWFESLIVERLAIAAAVSADLWVQAWMQNGRPALCHTWQTPLRPNFISPNSKACLGYLPNPEVKMSSTPKPESALPPTCLSEY